MGRLNEKREKIVFIGYGKVSSSIGESIKDDFDIFYVSRHIMGKGFIKLKESLNFKNFVISRKDDEFQETVDEIVSEFSDVKGKVFLSVSGAYGSLEMMKLKKIGGKVGSFHLPYSFTSYCENIKGRVKTMFFEGDSEAERLVKKIAESIVCKIVKISQKNKLIYHLIMTLYGNYPFYILKLSDELVMRYFNKDTGKYIVESAEELFLKSFLNYKNHKKISGPLERGDFELIEKEIKALHPHYSDLIKKVFKASKEIKKLLE